MKKLVADEIQRMISVTQFRVVNYLKFSQQKIIIKIRTIIMLYTTVFRCETGLPAPEDIHWEFGQTDC
jgi:hypothetical protein